MAMNPRGMSSMENLFYGNPVALNWNAPDEGGNAVRVQLSPFGEFTLNDGGKKDGTVQHCTREAFAALVANWRAAGSPFSPRLWGCSGGEVAAPDESGLFPTPVGMFRRCP